MATGNVEEKEPEKHGTNAETSQVAVRNIRDLRQEVFQFVGENKIGKTFNNQNQA